MRAYRDQARLKACFLLSSRHCFPRMKHQLCFGRQLISSLLVYLNPGVCAPCPSSPVCFISFLCPLFPAAEPAALGNVPFGNPLSPAVSPVRSPTGSPYNPNGGGGSPMLSPTRTPTSSLPSRGRNLNTFTFDSQVQYGSSSSAANSPTTYRSNNSPGGGGSTSPVSPHRMSGRQVGTRVSTPLRFGVPAA